MALGNAGQEQRPAGDRLEMPSGLGEPHKEIPPIVDQGDETGRQPATGQILRREPAPPPLVLQFIEGILAIRPVAIELAESEELSIERSHQRRVFVDLALLDLGERKPELAGEVIAMVERELLLDTPAQKNDTASP